MIPLPIAERLYCAMRKSRIFCSCY